MGCGTPTHTEDLKTCDDEWLCISISEGKEVDVREIAVLLTDDTLCDPLQLFAERRHGLDRCPFCEHWENAIVVSTKQTLIMVHN